MEKLISLKIKNASKVIFLPNWVDEKDVNPIIKDKSRIINQLQWQEKIVFQFFGNIGRLQGIENLLCAIEMVKNGLVQKIAVDVAQVHSLLAPVAKAAE